MIPPDRELSLRRLAALARGGRDLSHRLKNLLGVAMGSIELCLQELQEEGPRKDCERSLEALEGMNRLLTRVQDLLRGPEEDPGTFDLLPPLQELLEDLRPLLERRGRSLHPAAWPEAFPVRARPRDLLGILTSALVAGRGERLEIHLLLRSFEGDACLEDGDYAQVILRGLDLEESPAGWDLGLETLNLRASGGDLRQAGGDLVLVLPRPPEAWPG